MRKVPPALALAMSVGVAVACAGSGLTADRATGVSVVLYGVGLSTDPYGNSRPRGFGVVTGLPGGRLRIVAVRRRELASFEGPQWLDRGRILVPRRVPPLRPPLVFQLDAGRLVELGTAPVSRLDLAPMWSPDGRLIATEPVRVEKCPSTASRGLVCWASGGVVYVVRADGTRRRRVARGHLGGWTPGGRVLLTTARMPGRWALEYQALTLSTGRRSAIIPRAAVASAAGVRSAGFGRPSWSADRRFVAAFTDVAWPKGTKITATIVLARGDGRVIRLITSRYVISMLAWSPRGHRLAWTTSGFPNPHELFVLDRPSARPRRLFAPDNRHFDWISWSPDGRFLLVDDVNLEPLGRPRGAWRLLNARTGRTVRLLPRLGGRPLWCCPVNGFVRP